MVLIYFSISICFVSFLDCSSQTITLCDAHWHWRYICSSQSFVLGCFQLQQLHNRALDVNRSHWRQLIYTIWKCKLKIIRNWHSTQSAYEIIYEPNSLTATNGFYSASITFLSSSLSLFRCLCCDLTRLSNSIQLSVNWADIFNVTVTELWIVWKKKILANCQIAATIYNRRR